MLKDFRAFVLRGNVVDLAIGVVIGAAFTSIVNAIVSGLINPVVSFVGTGSLEEKALCVGGYHKDPETMRQLCDHLFNYGQVLSAMLQFVIVAAVIFFAVVKPVNALMARFKADAPVDETTRDCPECLSTIPRKAGRCMYCTAKVEPVTA